MSGAEVLTDGALGRLGLVDEIWQEAARALLEEVRAGGIETIRVLFPDPHGVLRGKTVTAAALPSVLADGLKLPSTLLLKDTSQRTAFPIWADDGAPVQGAADVLLRPDPGTFRRLPWAPHSAWVLCDVFSTEGETIAFDTRHILRAQMARLAQAGLAMKVGLELEFHLYEVTDARLGHEDQTMPPAAPQVRPLAPGYQYLSETAYAQMEPAVDRIRRAAEGIGLAVRSTEVEMGPGQVEFTFDAGDPMAQADALVMFRTLAKEVSAAHGLHATFMCRPAVENAAASGWHVHQSLIDTATGANVFMPDGGALTAPAAGWIAGLLTHARESCLLTTPTVNGYKRYVPHQLAPDRIQWGRDNRGAMLRGLMAPGDPASRVENRVPDPAANPYLVFAAQIISGLAGIEAGAPPPAPAETPYDGAAEALPRNMGAAIEAFAASPLYRSVLGEGVRAWFLALKRAEWDRYLAAVSDWEQAEYFRTF